MGGELVITYLCIKEPLEGDIKGVCCVCGKETEKGHKPSFSGTFTGYSFMTHGDCQCPHCYTFFKNQAFRKRSWVATKNGVRFLKRLEFREVIINPPNPPFFLYLTKSGQRQGWLSALRYVNYCRDRFYLSTDFVDTVYVNRNEAVEMSRIIAELRGYGVSKTALLFGQLSMKMTRIAIESGWWDLFDSTRLFLKNPLWEVMVYVAE